MKTKYYIFLTYLLLCFSESTILADEIDLDKIAQNFVMQKKQIEVPGYPAAFNPSIIRYQGHLLMSFRYLSHPSNLWHSKIGLVWLDENFNAISKPQLIDTRMGLFNVPSRSEDARLFSVGDRLFVIYNDYCGPYDDGVRRMYITEIFVFNRNFYVSQAQGFFDYEDQLPWKWEKNWVPFEYNGNMFFAYKILPHQILMPIESTGVCDTVGSISARMDWPWGELRGGTPALKQGDEYLAFHHSWKYLRTKQSNNDNVAHYFMAAYTFRGEPPFEITRMSPEPIIGRGMYGNRLLWDKNVVFPGGYVSDDRYIWILYGKDDQQCWVVKLNKQGLLDSLIPVESE